MKTFGFMVLVLFLGVSAVYAEHVRVIDGDTIMAIFSTGGVKKCDLFGIDAPEVATWNKPGQAFGEESMEFLRKLVEHYRVKINIVGKKHGRFVCSVKKGSLDVSLEMVKRGMAWVAKDLKQPYLSKFRSAEIKARNARLGLWSNTDPIKPWEFRRQFNLGD